MLYFNQKKREREDKKMYAYDTETMAKRAREMTLEELKEARFLNSMADRWTPEEWAWDAILADELKGRNHK
jgi:hypothetical protein